MEPKFVKMTKKGYDFFEVSSAMQKAIRRGETEDAIYWAYELWRSGNSKYVWKRLLIIAVEDIGSADVEAMTLANTFYQNYLWLKDMESNKESHELVRPMLATVMTLAGAKKSGLYSRVYTLLDQHDSF